jgi:hypothetical protein
MKEYKFEAKIIKPESVDSGYIEFPYDVYKEFGKKGQVKVKAYFDGFEYRGSLVKMGTECHIIGLNKKVRDAINKQAGDTVQVLIVEDTDERTVEVPQDLNVALGENPSVRAIFEKLSFTHRKEYVVWIISAKREETRLARIDKCIEMLTAGKKNPGDKS